MTMERAGSPTWWPRSTRAGPAEAYDGPWRLDVPPARDERRQPIGRRADQEQRKGASAYDYPWRRASPRARPARTTTRYREGINFASASKQSTTVRSEEATTCCGRCKGTVDGEAFEHKALVFPTWPTKSLRTKTAPKADIHITCESVIASLLEVQQARTSATYSKGSLIVHELLLPSVSSDPQAHVRGPCLRSCPHILARTRRKST